MAMHSRPIDREVARRVAAIAYTQALVWAGHSKTAAVASAAREFEVSARTIWTWLSQVRGVAQGAMLPYLVPLTASRRDVHAYRIAPISEQQTRHAQR